MEVELLFLRSLAVEIEKARGNKETLRIKTELKLSSYANYDVLY